MLYVKLAVGLAALVCWHFNLKAVAEDVRASLRGNRKPIIDRG